MRNKALSVACAVVLGFLVATNPVVADAARQITGGAIKDGSIKSVDVGDGTIRGKDVRNQSLTPADVRGVNRIGGYEHVEKKYDDVALPMGGAFSAPCPGEKKVLSGGAIIQLYNAAGFVGLGSPARYSYPTPLPPTGSGWIAYFSQSSVNGATKADITVRATCATAAP